MSMKLTIILDNKQDYDLLVEAIIAFREQTVYEAQADGNAPVGNALLLDKAQRLDSLFRKVTF